MTPRRAPATRPRPVGGRSGTGTAGRADAGVALRGIAGKAGYSLSCILAGLVLVASAFSYFVVRDVSSIGGSHAIAGTSSTGAQNILLMGLESRRDWNGNILPASILARLHAGNAQAVANGAGGNATNTLILIHIPAGGKKAVGFSIPRDDWVNFAGTVGPQQQGKIDQAYGVSMYYEMGMLRAKYPNMGQDRLAFLGNEAGRRAAVATVQKLTGVHIDHFAEVNMDGFYELARVLGGVQVCLKHATRDYKSGAHFHKGYQHLDAAQALAFVRQRDNLPNGDLDRTHRQQAFVASVMHQLRTAGVLSDLAKLQGLLSVAQRYVITDAGWNLLEFAAETRNLTSGNLIFHTLPIKGYAQIAGQDVNVVEPAYLKAIVRAAFSAIPSFVPRAHSHRTAVRPARTTGRPARTTVDVLNGGSTAGLARRVSAALAKTGYRAGQIGDTSSRTTTAVLYGHRAAANAGQIAQMFGVTAMASASVAPGHVEILLGAGATVPKTGASGQPRTPSAVIPTAGPQGGAVLAANGIPCVN